MIATPVTTRDFFFLLMRTVKIYPLSNSQTRGAALLATVAPLHLTSCDRHDIYLRINGTPQRFFLRPRVRLPASAPNRARADRGTRRLGGQHLPAVSRPLRVQRVGVCFPQRLSGVAWGVCTRPHFT